MFGFFKALFASKPAASAVAPAAVDVAPRDAIVQPKAAKVSIPYNSELIKSCLDDHQELLAIYTAMMEAAEARDFANIDSNLVSLSQGLKAHFNKEFTELYTYLDLRTRKGADKEEFERVRQFRMELQQIGVQINDIVNRYEKGVDADSLERFIEDYKQLGAALGDRIQREESVLYPIYQKYQAA